MTNKKDFGPIIDFVLTVGFGIFVAIFIIFPYLDEALGLLWAILGVILLPITMPIVPLIIFFYEGNILPAIIVYGGVALIIKGRGIWGSGGRWNI
jgi:hypothetical protein